MKWKIIRNSIKNWLKLEAKLIQNGFKMEPKMRLASWLANWLAGWMAGSLAGGSRDRGTRVNEGNTLVLGPWGKPTEGGSRQQALLGSCWEDCCYAERTAAIAERNCYAERTAAMAERNCCRENCCYC